MADNAERLSGIGYNKELAVAVVVGFMTDSTGSSPTRWARPVGVATDWRGNLYVGSDAGNPKQSGSMYSALVFPNSRRKYSVP